MDGIGCHNYGGFLVYDGKLMEKESSWTPGALGFFELFWSSAARESGEYSGFGALA